MTADEKRKLASKILMIIVVIGFLASGIVEFSKGSREKAQCKETSTAEITSVRTHSARGLVDKTVYYEFVVGDTLYKCTDYYSFFVSYPRGRTETVHYNANKPSESYLGNTPCGTKNGTKDFIISLVFSALLVIFIKKDI